MATDPTPEQSPAAAGDWIARLGLADFIRWTRTKKVAFVLGLGELAILTILTSLSLSYHFSSVKALFAPTVVSHAIYVTLGFFLVNAVLLGVALARRRNERRATVLVAMALALATIEVFYYVYLSGLFSIAVFIIVGSIIIARVAFGRAVGHFALAQGNLAILAMALLYEFDLLGYAPVFATDLGSVYTDSVVLWQYTALAIVVQLVVYATTDFATDRMERAIADLEQTNRDLVLAQADLAGSKPLASLGALVAGAAKELNNPLSISLSVSESVVRDLGERYSSGIDREGVSDLFNEISTSLEAQQRAARIINQLADLSAYSQQTSYEPMDVNLAIRQSLQSLANPVAQAGELVTLTLANDLPLARGQMALFAHVFAHVHTNALWSLADAQEPSGQPPAVEVQTRVEGSRIVYRCRDTGPGMDSEQLAHCHEPFYTTRRARGGVGLGLYLVDQVVRWAGGTFHVESKPGEGTLVEIVLAPWEG